MSQRRIVKLLQDIRGYLVNISHSPYLRVHALHSLCICPGWQIELMADDHISLRRIDLLAPDQAMQSLVIGQVIAVLIHPGELFYHGRPDKRQQVKVHRARFILQNDFLNLFSFHSRRLADHVYILSGEHASEAVDPGTAVMISCDHHHRCIRQSRIQPCNKTVKHFHCLCRRHCLSVDISRYDHCLRLFPNSDVRDLPQNIFLIFPKIPVKELQPDVQVRKMKKFHPDVLLICFYSTYLSLIDNRHMYAFPILSMLRAWYV